MENEVQNINLPRTEDMLNWCAWLVPVILLLLWDVWKAWKRRALWIPGQALVLSAFIIQLLSFIDYSHISVYSGSSYQTKEVVAVLVKNQLVIDSGRLMMCVLIAYLLPGMARSGSIMDGIELAALVLGITLNILSEVQSVWKVKKRNESLSAPAADYNVETKGSDRKWSKVCSTTLFIATIFLLLLLIQAAMMGRSIRRIMSQKITSALSCCCTPCDRPRCNETKDHVLKCWMVARVSQPDYVLVRSGLCSEAWLSVTVCIVVSVIKWRYVQLTYYESLSSGNKRTLTQFVIVGQFVIVLIGWIVLFIREVNSVYISDGISNIEYYRMMSIDDAQNDLNAYLIRLWVRDKRIQEKRIQENRILNPKHWVENLRVLNLEHWLQELRVSDPEQWLQKLRVLDPEHWLQKLRVPVSKLSGYFFQNDFVRVVTEQMLARTPLQTLVSKLVYDNGQFSKYKESLEMLLIPGESASSLWIANQWGFRKVERYMKQGQKDGECSPSKLTDLLGLETGTAEGEAGKSAKEEKAHLQQANKNSWKRTAVSLIHFMIYSYDGSDASASVIEDAMQCYLEVWEYMNFVDGLNEEVKSLGRQADKEFDSLQQSWNKRVQLDSEIKQPLDQLKSCSDEERRNLQNSRDSREVAKYCLLETWTVIDPSLSAPQINKIKDYLANVYFFYMTEDLNKAVLQKCSKLAEEGMEEEILHVAFLSAKAQGVLDKVREGHNTDQGSISSPTQTENELDGEGNDPEDPVEPRHNTDQASTSSTIPTVNEQVGEGNGQAELRRIRSRRHNEFPSNTDQTEIVVVVEENDPRDPAGEKEA